MIHTKFGWTNDDEFLWGDLLYSSRGVERVKISDPLQLRCRLLGERDGSLGEWSTAANTLFASRCEPLSIALLHSFAAPLMRFQSHETPVICYLCRRSVTLDLMMAAIASAWGKPDGLFLGNDNPSVSQQLTTRSLGNLPAIYNRLELIDPGIISSTIWHLIRSKQKTILATASTVSVVKMIYQGPRKRRVLELKWIIPEGLNRIMHQQILPTLINNRGNAGHAYLSWLVQPENRKWAKAAFKQYADEFGMASRTRRIKFNALAEFAAAITVAGIICRNLGILEFSIDRISEWLMERILWKHRAI